MYIFIVSGNKNTINHYLSGTIIKLNNGIFAGHISRVVANKIYKSLCDNKKIKGIIMVSPSDNEQHMHIDCFGCYENNIININENYFSTIK